MVVEVGAGEVGVEVVEAVDVVEVVVSVLSRLGNALYLPRCPGRLLILLDGVKPQRCK